jgi:antitoxin CptB
MTVDAARVRWRCRRGMRELDQLLGWYFEQRFAQSGDAGRQAFAELLEQPDPELWSWLLGQTTPARSDWRSIIDEIRCRDRV